MPKHTTDKEITRFLEILTNPQLVQHLIVRIIALDHELRRRENIDLLTQREDIDAVGVLMEICEIFRPEKN